MSLDAFQPQGLSQLIAATTTASTAIQLSAVGAPAARVVTDAAVFVAWGSSTGSSGITATAPTTSTPANGMRMLANSLEVFTLGGQNLWLSFITSAAAGANVWVVGGYGS